MGYASQAGRARTSSKTPQAHAICDRCGERFNHVDLKWQYDWRGASLVNLRLLVCEHCYDAPQQQLRSIVIPADPMPIQNPRPELFAEANSDVRVVSGAIYGATTDPITGIPVPSTTQRVTSSSGDATTDLRVTQQIGPSSRRNNAPSLDPNAVMPLYEATAYGVILPVSAMVADGTTILTVTCTTAHGLNSGDQIAVEGTSLSTTDGFYNVTVTSPVQFTYEVASAIFASSAIFIPNTVVKTAFIGVPRNMGTIPQMGIL